MTKRNNLPTTSPQFLESHTQEPVCRPNKHGKTQQGEGGAQASHAVAGVRGAGVDAGAELALVPWPGDPLAEVAVVFGGAEALGANLSCAIGRKRTNVMHVRGATIGDMNACAIAMIWLRNILCVLCIVKCIRYILFLTLC